MGPGNRVPARQLSLQRKQLDVLRESADFPETTPNNQWIIRQFKLPAFERDPELYRLSGPFWNRRLQGLWGCERVMETSLPPAAALPKLPVTSAAKSWPGAAAVVALGCSYRSCSSCPWLCTAEMLLSNPNRHLENQR